MPALPATVSPPSADADSAEVLFGTALPGGEQEGEPAALATEAGKPGLLLRRAARESKNRHIRRSDRIIKLLERLQQSMQRHNKRVPT
jgi:hypothetical protein